MKQTAEKFQLKVSERILLNKFRFDKNAFTGSFYLCFKGIVMV